MIRQTIKILLLPVIVLLYIETAYSSSYRVPKKPASVTVADINLDGYPDILLGHEIGGIGGLVSILINDGLGRFTFADSLVTGAYETSIQTGYIDSNSKPDIIMLDYNSIVNSVTFGVVRDYGVFGFDSIMQYPLNQQLTIWDYIVNDLNNDQYDDIVFISHLSKLAGIIENESGSFSQPAYIYFNFHPSGLAVGRINDDNRNDIAVSGNAKVIKLYLDKPSGLDTITIDTSPLIMSPIAITDINNDNKNEIIGVDGGMPGTRKRLMIYSKDMNGVFQLSYSKWIDEAMSKIFIADLNNDSFNDIIYNTTLYYPNSNYEVFHTYILFNNKDGTFQDPVNYYTGICSHVSYAADLDGNGWKDIITLNYDFYNPPPDTCSIHILFNDGTGRFQEDPVTDVKDEKPILAAFELYQNYPNPFNPSTTISYALPFESEVSVTIYDLTGSIIKSFVFNNQSIGYKDLLWDGRNNYGQLVTSGVYIYTIKAVSLKGNGKTFVKSSKCMLLK